MPEAKIQLQPGLDSVSTPTLNSASWSSSNLIRWLNGHLQKVGGWVKFCNTACSGVVRGLHAFEDLSFNQYLATGSNERLQIVFGGNLYDITPIRQTDNLTNALSTVALSADVEVHDVGSQVSVGDWVYFLVPVAIGGLHVQGYYQVDNVIDADHYTFLDAQTATSTVVNGGVTPQYNTTATSVVIRTVFPGFGLIAGQIWTVNLATTVGGITLSGDYVIASTIDANTFTFNALASAVTTASAFENGDQARISYLLANGPSSDQALTGWGAGPYGLGPYGIGASSGTGNAVLPLRNWFLDNFGQLLVAVPTNGAIYIWTPPIGPANPAVPIGGDSPTMNAGMFVAMPQAQIIALGAETAGVQDLLLIRWCDIGDYTDWTATVINQAGSFRLSRGSRIIGGMQAPQSGLIWTDIDVWTMQYQSQPFIYGFLVAGTGCGLISPKGMTIQNGTVFWMSLKSFYTYGNSTVNTLNCTVWDQVFGDLDMQNLDKIFGAANSLFNEIAFFYPSLSGGTGEIDKYVKFCTTTGSWDYGDLDRTAWIDENLFGTPIGVESDGFIQQHEMTSDADGAPMTGVFAESGYADISDGTMFVFVDQIIPDFYMTGANPSVTMTIYTTNWPGTPPTAFGPYLVTPETQYITIRTRARQISFKIESDSLGTFWRLGAIRYRGSPAGRV